MFASFLEHGVVCSDDGWFQRSFLADTCFLGSNTEQKMFRNSLAFPWKLLSFSPGKKNHFPLEIEHLREELLEVQGVILPPSSQETEASRTTLT